MARRKPAFTILEILTVIGILTLLIGILLPSLSAARRHAKANVCLSTLSGIGTAFTVYLNENDDHFPPFRIKKPRPDLDLEVDYINEYGRRAPRWQWFLETDMGPVMDIKAFQYAIDADGYFDDETRSRYAPSDPAASRRMAYDAFTCPSLVDEDFAMDIRNGAFGYNYQYLGNTRDGKLEGRWNNFAVGLHRIQASASTVLAADSRGAAYDHGEHSYTLDPPRLAVEENAVRFGPSDSDIAARWDDAAYMDGEMNVFQYSPAEMRHNKRSNVLFVDSHAAAMTAVELGYQIGNATQAEGLPKETPIPILKPKEGIYRATNKLWNGRGFDRLAEEHRSQTPQEPGE